MPDELLLRRHPQHVLLENHGEVLIASLGIAPIGLHVLGIFQDDAAPKHGDENEAEYCGAAALSNEPWQFQQMRMHRQSFGLIISRA